MTTKIIGTGSYLPEHVVSNDDLAKLVDTSDEWIASRTGIRNRRIATKESGADMAAAAAEEALNMQYWETENHCCRLPPGSVIFSFPVLHVWCKKLSMPRTRRRLI